MRNSIEIQNAVELTEDLLAEVLLLEQACFPDDPWTAPMFAVNDREGILLARSDDILVAYLCHEQILDECHILNVAVHPDYRRMGVARTLIARLIQEKSDVRDWFLEVRVSNSPALFLYESLGFRAIGRRVRYYRNGEDAIVMCLTTG